MSGRRQHCDTMTEFPDERVFTLTIDTKFLFLYCWIVQDFDQDSGSTYEEQESSTLSYSWLSAILLTFHAGKMQD